MMVSKKLPLRTATLCQYIDLYTAAYVFTLSKILLIQIFIKNRLSYPTIYDLTELMNINICEELQVCRDIAQYMM